MVSGLKPTKLSWLAVVQEKAPNPHVWAEWFLFWGPENKNENGKQVPFLAAKIRTLEETIEEMCLSSSLIAWLDIETI